MLNLPEHASVLIGGGIMGCSTLCHLEKMGGSYATLLERNKLTSGTTWRSAAQVRACPPKRPCDRKGGAMGHEPIYLEDEIIEQTTSTGLRMRW